MVDPVRWARPKPKHGADARLHRFTTGIWEHRVAGKILARKFLFCGSSQPNRPSCGNRDDSPTLSACLGAYMPSDSGTQLFRIAQTSPRVETALTNPGRGIFSPRGSLSPWSVAAFRLLELRGHVGPAAIVPNGQYHGRLCGSGLGYADGASQ
jgi:hypothetical protein